SLLVGSHTITASYGGVSNFLPSTTALMQTVGKASTNTVVVASLNPSTSGQSVTFTATLSVQSPGAGTPTGTVQFGIDGSNSGGPVNVSFFGGVTTANFSTASLTGGSHTVTASYNGDTTFNPSTSAPLTEMVNKASTSIAVVSSVS